MNILITGGSSGLGKALVEKFAMGKDNHVGFTFCSKKASAEELMSRFCNVSSYKVDYCDNQGVDLFVDQLSGIPVDVLINNVYSGKAQGTHFHKTDFADFETSFHDNIIPFIKINQVCIAGMRKRKYGKIVNVLTSYLIDVPPAGFSVYTATKAYIRDFIKKMRVKDSSALRRYMADNEPGMDYNITVERPKELGGGSFTTFLQLDQFLFLNIA